MQRGKQYYSVILKSRETFRRIDPWSSKSEGCFIATATYGTTMASEINYLRLFRDDYLKQNFITSNFVNLYYRISLPIAKIVSTSLLLKRFFRFILNPIVQLLRYWYRFKIL